MSIRVVIVDDHEVVINGLVTMLEHFKQIEVVGTYSDGENLLKGLEKMKMEDLPDVLILDIHIPDIQGDELAEKVTEKYPTIRILAMTGVDTTFYVKTMLEKGCLGYLLKNTDKAILIQAIEAVNSGHQFIDPSLRQQVLEDVFKNRKQDSFALTRREKDILAMIVDEHTSQEIAEKLYLSLKTVENHRNTLMQKLGAKNIAGLVRVAMRMGLVR